MATKKENWESVLNLLEQDGVKKSTKLYKRLEELLAPKSRSVSNEFPPILIDGEISELYCVWFKEYRLKEDFNKSTKSKSGYHYECKEAEAEWKKYGKQIKLLKEYLAQLMDAVFDGLKDPDKVKKERTDILKEIELLESNRKAKINFDLHQSIYELKEIN